MWSLVGEVRTFDMHRGNRYYGRVYYILNYLLAATYVNHGKIVFVDKLTSDIYKSEQKYNIAI